MSIAPAEVQQPILHAGHRCDRCSSRAYVLVVLKWSPGLPHAGELLFCAHDFKKNEAALAPYVSMIVDERSQLQEHVRDTGHVS
jgi:hypothetical protein